MEIQKSPLPKFGESIYYFLITVPKMLPFIYPNVPKNTNFAVQFGHKKCL